MFDSNFFGMTLAIGFVINNSKKSLTMSILIFLGILSTFSNQHF